MADSFVVAIAGGSASGKSTLAEALVRSIVGRTVESIPTDRYMRRNDPEAPSFFFQFAGKVTMDCNSPDSSDNAAILRAVEASAADVVIVEGLMTLAVAEIRERANLRVFVDLDADVRAIRRMKRDILTPRGGGSGDPAFIAAYYLESARVGHARYVEPSKSWADLIVRGDADPERTASLLAASILPRL